MAKITTGTTNGDIKITPNGTGKFVVAGTAGNVEYESSGAVINFTRNSANYINATQALGYLIFSTGGTESLRIDSSKNLKFDSGYGSVATAYGCRAWVNFNGTGTVAIRESGNVSSITDNGGIGDYTVNFATAMPDANYSAVGNGGAATGAGFDIFTPWQQAPTTTTCRIGIFNGSGSTAVDCKYTQIAFFR